MSGKVLLGMLSLVFLISVSQAERTKEVGLLNYFGKYEYVANKLKEPKYIKALKKYFTQLENMGKAPEWVDVDVFLPNQKSERDKYKRIIIPYRADWFTLDMYKGMLDYVRSGGLLVTHSGLLLLDEKGEYQCAGGKITDFCRKTFLGIEAVGGSNQPEIKVLVDNPLTKGLELNKWLNVGVSGRRTKKLTANVAVISKQKSRTRSLEGPFLSWKSMGKGACVYLVCPYLSKKKPIDLLMRNILSEETLKWLCVQSD